VSRGLGSKSAHMTRCTRRGRHIGDAETTRSLRPVPLASLGMIHHTVGGLRVDLLLRMVGAQMTLTADLRFADLCKRELVAEVTLVAVPDAAVCVRLADRMAALAGHSCDGGCLNVEE